MGCLGLFWALGRVGGACGSGGNGNGMMENWVWAALVEVLGSCIGPLGTIAVHGLSIGTPFDCLGPQLLEVKEDLALIVFLVVCVFLLGFWCLGSSFCLILMPCLTSWLLPLCFGRLSLGTFGSLVALFGLLWSLGSQICSIWLLPLAIPRLCLTSFGLGTAVF